MTRFFSNPFLSTPGPSPSINPFPNIPLSRIKVLKTKKKEGFEPWADTKITWIITPPPPPHDQEEGYQSTLSLRRGFAKYLWVSMRCPKSQVQKLRPMPKYLWECMRGVQVKSGPCDFRVSPWSKLLTWSWTGKLIS